MTTTYIEVEGATIEINYIYKAGTAETLILYGLDDTECYLAGNLSIEEVKYNVKKLVERGLIDVGNY